MAKKRQRIPATDKYCQNCPQKFKDNCKGDDCKKEILEKEEEERRRVRELYDEAEESIPGSD